MHLPEGDIVILVRESDDPVAVIFGHREQVTEYVRDLRQRKESGRCPAWNSLPPALTLWTHTHPLA